MLVVDYFKVYNRLGIVMKLPVIIELFISYV